MSKIIGIDLGTTNSAVAHLVNGKSEIIANAEGLRTTPSIVYIKGDELLVGELAKRKAVLEPQNVVYEVKRFIGMKYDEVKTEAERMPYKTKKEKMEEFLSLSMRKNTNQSRSLHLSSRNSKKMQRNFLEPQSILQ